MPQAACQVVQARRLQDANDHHHLEHTRRHIKQYFRHNRPPRVKSRPRRGKGRTYTEKQVVAAEQEIALDYIRQQGRKFTGPIAVRIRLHRDHIRVHLRDLPEDWRSGLRGDADNYAKLVLDGLNGVAYNDDKQVMSLTVEKVRE